MTVRLCAVAALAVCLPRMDDAPALTAPVARALQALLGGSKSASVEDLHVLAFHLDDLSRRSGLPEEARRLLMAARDALLGRRIRNHASQAGGSGRRASKSGSSPVTATMQVSVG